MVDFVRDLSGMLFSFLLILLVILGGVYWYLVVKQKEDRSDDSNQSFSTPLTPPELLQLQKPKEVSEPLRIPEQKDISPPKEEDSAAAGTLFSLGKRLKQIRQITKTPELPDEGRKAIHHVVDAGKSAMDHGQWGRAKVYFEEAFKLSRAEPGLALNLSIVCYELGELDNAEKYYGLAIEMNPASAKAFRNHLAFRL